MKKHTLIAGIILGALFISTMALLFINSPSNKKKQELLQEEKFEIIDKNDTEVVYKQLLEDIGIVEIPANYKPSGKAPTVKKYQGVSFKQIIEKLEINTDSYTSVIFTAVDGYTTAITIEEAMDEEKCAIVISLDNQPLGKKEDGGSGPYMMILPKDQFSQRWCKFLGKVEFQ